MMGRFGHIVEALQIADQQAQLEAASKNSK